MSKLELDPAAKKQVDEFAKNLSNEVEHHVAKSFPDKIAQLDAFLKEPALNVSDLSTLKAELDIPIPDPEKDKLKEKEKKKKKKEKDDKDDKSKSDDEDSGPPCGPVSSNEKITALLNRLKPEIKEVKEKLSLVAVWVQMHIPKIEDGNNFGVQVQEKVFELMTNIRTKLEGFQTQISKYFLDRGDAVAKAAKQPHVGDYRQLVHELDEAEYAEIRAMLLEVRNTYAILVDIVIKNFDKLKRPRGGDTKRLIY
ncbi:proteasome activator complex subunit 1 isoform X2 [Protopterus annectens]|nr:proteasome activator complex subunit 1 isoform X2 [Protopterus annectens]